MNDFNDLKAQHVAEEKMKSQYAGQTQTCSQDQTGYAVSPSLQERISNQIYRAKQESQNLDKLSELQYLLNKYPELARIFELIELVKH